MGSTYTKLNSPQNAPADTVLVCVRLFNDQALGAVVWRGMSDRAEWVEPRLAIERAGHVKESHGFAAVVVFHEAAVTWDNEWATLVEPTE